VTAPYIPDRRSLLDALEAMRMQALAPVQPDATRTRPLRPDASRIPQATIRGTSAPMPKPLDSNVVTRALDSVNRMAAPSPDTPKGFLRDMVSPIRQGVQAREMVGEALREMRSGRQR
jgi:hypothetical protein